MRLPLIRMLHIQSPQAISVVVVTNKGQVDRPDLLAKAQRVHRQLRPQLSDDAKVYAARIAEICKNGNDDMAVAVQDNDVVGVTMYRTLENTFCGRRFYVDDLVTDETKRSTGVGHALMEFLRAEAKRRGADSFDLESGTQRIFAHKFYFREGFVVKSFSFHLESYKKS